MPARIGRRKRRRSPVKFHVICTVRGISTDISTICFWPNLIPKTLLIVFEGPTIIMPPVLRILGYRQGRVLFDGDAAISAHLGAESTTVSNRIIVRVGWWFGFLLRSLTHLPLNASFFQLLRQLIQLTADQGHPEIIAQNRCFWKQIFEKISSHKS